MKLHHSMATDNGIENYVEMLEEEHGEMRKEIFNFQQKFQQLSFIVTSLEEMQYENEELKQEVASMRTSVFEQEQQRQLIETQLQNEISDLQRSLEAAESENKNLLCKLSLFEQTETQILDSNLQTTNEVLQSTPVGIYQQRNQQPDAQQSDHSTLKCSPLVNNRATENRLSLRATAMKWQSDCESVKFDLIKENVDLTTKLVALQGEYQNDLDLKTAELKRLTDDNRSLKSTLDLAIETLSIKLYHLDEVKAELYDLKSKQQEESSVREENESLKQQVASLRETELKLMDDKENLKTRLNSLYSKNRKILDAKQAAERAADQERSLVEEHLSTIASLKSDLELASKIMHEKTLADDELRHELAEVKTLCDQLGKQNEEIKIDMERLNASVRKRKSDWRSSELKLTESNEDLKKKLGRLQTENHRLLEKNSLVKTDLEIANKVLNNLRETTAAKEHETIELRKELEGLRTESERMMNSCKAASLFDQHTPDLVRTNGLLETQTDLSIPESSARRPSSQSESDVDVSHQPCAEMQELQTKLQVLEAENQNFTTTIAVMQQAEEEAQRTIQDLMMQYRLATEKNEAVIQANRTAIQAAEEQADALSEALTALREGATEGGSIVGAEKIDEMGSTDITQKDTDITKKKKESKFKRWLKKSEFRKPKVSQNNAVIKLMQNAEKSLSQKANNLKERAQNLLKKRQDLRK
ncbi:uncharacterized protein LOC130696128 [Daphnia carinata]|uniref:uncharacterized protein LOC130696128 n=1 Tax=Daphnia carinata TaxID=120202 RepID=UPI0028692877|nr:uncharacterized protein LOC130696128 [Daphnia carinata]